MKEKNAQNRKQNVSFLMCICIHDVISDIPVVSTFKGEYTVFLPDIIFESASRLYAIAWVFLLRHKRILITAIYAYIHTRTIS